MELSVPLGPRRETLCIIRAESGILKVQMQNSSGRSEHILLQLKEVTSRLFEAVRKIYRKAVGTIDNEPGLEGRTVLQYSHRDPLLGTGSPRDIWTKYMKMLLCKHVQKESVSEAVSERLKPRPGCYC